MPNILRMAFASVIIQVALFSFIYNNLYLLLIILVVIIILIYAEISIRIDADRRIENE